jgi:plastocyanin
MTPRRVLALAVLVLSAIPIVAAATANAAPTARYTVNGLDFRFTGMPKTLKAGTHSITFVNRGEATHDFKIGTKKTRILNPGQRQTIRVTLKKGRYTVICTVPGHRQLGMRQVVTVK